MWKSHVCKIDHHTIKISLHDEHAQSLQFDEAFGLLRDSQEFRNYFTRLLSNSPFDAFFWEMPPVSQQTLKRPFECVLVESPILSQLKPDPSPFRSHFTSGDAEEVLTFPNLGGDALLIVPVPIAEDGCYTHLTCFLRRAPRSQVDTFWKIVNHALNSRISTHSIWLSTAGLGVSWLHLRLDASPKYYRHKPYKTQT